MTDQEAQEQVGQYRQLVTQYEALQAQIATILKGKYADELSEAEFKQYRALARERDEIQSEMRYFEQVIFDDADK